MMKRLVVLLVLLIPFTVSAQKKGYKLVEKSNPKGRPSWVLSPRDGYMLVQAVEASSLSEAKDIAYTTLIGDIAKSVSSSITVTIDHKTEELIREKGMTKTEYIESVKSEAQLRVAKMPDFQGVTLSNGEEYIERYYNKRNGSEYYNYYVLYPFTRFDLEELIDKFNAQERAINERIEKNKNVATEFVRTDEIDAALNDLGLLAKELEYGDSRIALIDNAKNQLRMVYKKLSVFVVDNRRERMVFKLVYDGRTITSSSMPMFSSTCAQQFDCIKDGDSYIVQFDESYCYDGDDNTVKILFRFKGGTVTKNVTLR